MVEVLSEGHTLAEKTGLGTSNLHNFISAMFPGPYTAYSQRMLDGDYYQREEPLFHVDLARYVFPTTVHIYIGLQNACWVYLNQVVSSSQICTIYILMLRRSTVRTA